MAHSNMRLGILCYFFFLLSSITSIVNEMNLKVVFFFLSRLSVLTTPNVNETPRARREKKY